MMQFSQIADELNDIVAPRSKRQELEMIVKKVSKKRKTTSLTNCLRNQIG